MENGESITELRELGGECGTPSSCFLAHNGVACGFCLPQARYGFLVRLADNRFFKGAEEIISCLLAWRLPELPFGLKDEGFHGSFCGQHLVSSDASVLYFYPVGKRQFWVGVDSSREQGGTRLAR